MHNNALRQGILAVLIFGTLPVTIRLVDVEPFTMGIFRLLMGIILLFPLIKITNEKIEKSDWKILFCIGICFGFHWLLYFYSIRISSASIGAVGVATFGVHILILGAVFLKTNFKLLDLIAVLIAVLGCLLIVPFTFKDNNTLGLILSVLSGFLYAVLPILHKKLIHISTKQRTY